MGKIVHYTASDSSGTAAKGTKENPYTQAEYDAYPYPFPGGYVEGIGYVHKDIVIVYGSSTGCSDDSFSDAWSSEFCDSEENDSQNTNTAGGGGGDETEEDSDEDPPINRQTIVDVATKYIGRNETNDIELIKQWLRNAGYSNPTDNTAWCAAFVYNMFQEAGFEGYKSAAVKGWETSYGKTVSEPEVGDVAFFPGSHIGIVAEVVGDSITVIHGNWGDKVSRTTHVKSYFKLFKRGG